MMRQQLRRTVMLSVKAVAEKQAIDDADGRKKSVDCMRRLSKISIKSVHTGEYK